MFPERRFEHTIRALYAHWPAFFIIYSGLVLCLVFIGISAQQGWLSYIPLILACMIVLGYFFAARLWANYQLYDAQGLRPHHALFDMGQINDTDSFVYIACAHRQRAFDLVRRLTTGHVTIIDIYNPQWMPNPALARWRSQHIPAVADPRITWKEGQFNFLPIPDGTVATIILCQVVGELGQEGDRLALIREVHRILAANGRLLIAERTSSRQNMALLEASGLDSSVKWKQLLETAGFANRSDFTLRGLIHCFRADKPSQAKARQMTLGLDFER